MAQAETRSVYELVSDDAHYGPCGFCGQPRTTVAAHRTDGTVVIDKACKPCEAARNSR